MIRTIAFALIMFLPGAVYALGLGKLDLRSGLNEPMDARIVLLSPTVDEVESLKVGLANTEAFSRADIDRTLVVTQLRFEVKEVENGSDYIRIYSREAVREPFLNFLLEINWNRGRLFREYTVLLDPPTYSPDLKFQETVPTKSQLRPLPEPATSGSLDSNKAANTVVEAGHTIVYNPQYQAATSSPSPGTSSPSTSSVNYTASVNYTGGDYTTSAGDTLWAIATGMRPDNSVSIQQMMLALYRANPEAFINNNINGLKRGQILTAPELSEIQSLSKSDAIEDVKSHNGLWDELRGIVASQVEERPESAGVSSAQVDEPISDSIDTTATTVTTEVSPELRLVAADESVDGAGQGSGETGIDSEALSKDLTMAQESLVTLEGENTELKDKLVEAESIIDDLKRLIVLKEDELAVLQNQISEQVPVEVPEEIIEEIVEEEPMAEEVMEEEVTEEELMEEEPMAEEVMEEELMEEEPMAEEVMEEEVMEEEVMEEEPMAEEVMEEETSVDTQMAQDAGGSGIMDMVQQYAGPAKDLVMENLTIIGGGVGGIILLLLGYVGFNKWRENKPEVVEFGEADIMDFEDIDDEQATAADLMDIDDSESVTELPDDENDVDITPTPQAPEPDDDKTQIAGFNDAPVEEEEPEEDPLAEVNVFLAYEHFDQAADFVKTALEEQPDNLDFHTKLLEVYYAANDKNSYEEAAQVLHDKVDGSGDHWDMAVAMWSEMSPNRALFEEREDGLDDTQEMPPGATESVMKGGIVDLTADEESSDEADTGALDFDVGDTTSEHMLDMTAADDSLDPMEGTLSEASEDDNILDITSNEPEDAVLDVTAAGNVDSQNDEDLLDVTAAVGLETEDESNLDISNEDGLLDITGDSDDNLLDLSSASGDDLLEMSTSGGEDLLDVTSAVNLQPDSEEDLLDVTTASSTSADNSDLLDIPEPSTEESDDGSLDFDIEGLDLDMTGGTEVDGESDLEITDNSVIERAMEDDSSELELPGSGEDDNVVDFDIQADSTEDNESVELEVDESSDVVDLDLSAPPSLDLLNEDSGNDDGEISLDMDSMDSEDPTLDVDLAVDDLSLDVDEQADESGSDDLEVDLGEDIADGGVELDLSNEFIFDEENTDESGSDDLEVDLDGDTDGGGVELDLSNEFSLDEENTDSIAQDFDLDLDIETDDEAVSVDNEDDIDMEGTIEMPKLDFDDDDDDDEQKTVFVPRSTGSDEQSLEDEVSTKLDLAKAYVELGDNDSAKTILDEIISEGSDEQKQQAQELLKQVS